MIWDAVLITAVMLAGVTIGICYGTLEERAGLSRRVEEGKSNG